MKLKNTQVLGKLETLGRVELREKLGKKMTTKFDLFEKKKNEVNKELIKL